MSVKKPASGRDSPSTNGAESISDRAPSITHKELYIKYKRSVDKVCEYLRLRSYVDGVHRHMKKPTQYKHWMFKHFLAACMIRNLNNYFGVVFDKDDIRGDTMFPDFYNDYHALSREYWNNNTRELYRLLQYYKEAYFRNTGFARVMDEQFYEKIFDTHLSLYMLERDKSPSETQGYLEAQRDELFKLNKLELDKSFPWPRRSKKQSKRDKRIDTKYSVKTRKSLSALQAATKGEFFIKDRFQLLFIRERESGRKPTIMVFDHNLRREHCYLKVNTHDMDHKYSLWQGIKDTNDDIEHFTNKLNLKEPPPVMAVPNKYDPENGPYNMDFSSGGYVAFGDPFEDSQLAILKAGEFVINDRAMVAIGKGSTARAAKILYALMQQKAAEATLYEQF